MFFLAGATRLISGGWASRPTVGSPLTCTPQPPHHFSRVIICTPGTVRADEDAEDLDDGVDLDEVEDDIEDAIDEDEDEEPDEVSGARGPTIHISALHSLATRSP